MGESQVVFGDKFFLADEFLRFAYLFEDFEENSVVINGYELRGMVVELMAASSLAPETPFDLIELVDVTDKLSIRLPTLSGTKVWMPTTPSHSVHSQMT